MGVTAAVVSKNLMQTGLCERSERGPRLVRACGSDWKGTMCCV